MPMYEAECNSCGHRVSYFSKIADRDTNLPGYCSREWHCGVYKRIISVPSVIPDLKPFISPNGVPINSRSEWRNDLKRCGAIAWEPGIERDIASNKQSQLDSAFKQIEAVIDSTVSSFVAQRKLET